MSGMESVLLGVAFAIALLAIIIPVLSALFDYMNPYTRQPTLEEWRLQQLEKHAEGRFHAPHEGCAGRPVDFDYRRV